MNSIKLIKGDCLEKMSGILNGSIDCIITDPPYGINLTPQRKDSKFKDTKVENDDNLDWLPYCVIEWKRILKKSSVLYCFCNWQNYDIFKQEIQKQFTIKNCIVWDKDWLGMGNNWRPNHEFIIVATNGKFKTKSNNKTNILKHRRLSSQKMLHSCEKPLSLIEQLIIESTDENNTILDSFMGSNSTGHSCLNTNRNFIGIELDDKYFDIGVNRVKENMKEGYELIIE